LREFPFIAARLSILTQINGTHIGQKGDGSGLFDLAGEGSLMFCTTPGQPAGNDFAAFRDKISQRFRVLIININAGIRAKPANFPAMKHSFFSSLAVILSSVS
jgi:hypothetical protein